MTSTTSLPRYAIISPVKDEEQFVELTLRSVTSQTVEPVAWVIVDDGSTDATQTIVREYATRYPFIRLSNSRTEGARLLGSAESQAFRVGHALLARDDYDFVVKLDGDLSFEPFYFEKLLARFETDDRLGIASGIYLESSTEGLWAPVWMPPYHAFGACKVVRRTCFEEIGGFLTTPGWDTVDEIRAWSRGWRTKHFTDLQVRHHKREGSAMGSLPTSVFHGEIYYVTGGGLLFFLFKVVRRLTKRPYIVGAVALVYGYLKAAIERRPRLVTEGEARCYRRILRQRLWSS